MMRSLSVIAAGLAAFTMFAITAVGAQGKPAPPGPGNSPAAQACQNGGWQNLATSTGQPFASQDECVAYAAHGGSLTPKRTVTVSFQPLSVFFPGWSGCIVVPNLTGFAPLTTYTVTELDYTEGIVIGQLTTNAEGGYGWPELLAGLPNDQSFGVFDPGTMVAVTVDGVSSPVTTVAC